MCRFFIFQNTYPIKNNELEICHNISPPESQNAK